MALRGRQVLMLVAVVVAVLALAATGIVVVLSRVGTGPAVSLTVTASSSGDLEVTRALLLARMRAAKLDDPSVTRSGERGLVLTARGTTAAQLRALTVPGRLRQRWSVTPAAGAEGCAPALPPPLVAGGRCTSWTAKGSPRSTRAPASGSGGTRRSSTAPTSASW
ncbi:hypothetical protein AB0H83_30710 [Dactylosporangium sp. NPDC050688]|uniref:hypothetical protein n=1 Tax=Dactylosporangium sp. NPDC050688 TaxID=3157217 RepID=UPI0033D4F851